MKPEPHLFFALYGRRPLTEAAEEFVPLVDTWLHDIGCPTGELVATSGSGGNTHERTRRYSPATLREGLAQAAGESLAFFGAGPSVPAQLDFRAYAFADEPARLWAFGGFAAFREPDRLLPLTRQLLLAAAPLLDLLHGGLHLFAGAGQAWCELSMVGDVAEREADPAFGARIGFEQTHAARLNRRARHIYWLTLLHRDLLGAAAPAAEAALGACPGFARLGAVLAVETTPDILDGLAADFPQKAQVAQSWLWPATLQNPSDTPFEPAVVRLATVQRVLVESAACGRTLFPLENAGLTKDQAVEIGGIAAGAAPRPTVLRYRDAQGRTNLRVFDAEGRPVDHVVQR